MTAETIKTARKIFRGYTKYKMEISQLEAAIKYHKSTAELDLNDDIYSASVSHGAGDTGIFAGYSAEKIPNIVEHMDKLRASYDAELSKLLFRRNTLRTITDSVDIYIDSLDWADRTILHRRFCESHHMNYDEISSEVNLSADSVKKREQRLIKQYAEISRGITLIAADIM